MKKITAALLTGSMLTVGAALLAPAAHADETQCHVGSGGEMWCEDLETGESWEAQPYGTYYTDPYCELNSYRSDQC